MLPTTKVENLVFSSGCSCWSSKSTEVEKMNTSIRTRKQPRKPSMTHEKAEMPGRSREGTRNAARGGRTSSKDRKFALQQDVDRLQKKLRHEENIHRALERAFYRPLGALPRLPPYLPPYTLGLVAEVAVLEEEIVRLEEQVLQFRQNLYHESVYISASKMKIQHSAAPGNNASSKDSPKVSKLKSLSQTFGNAPTSTTRPSSSTTLPEYKQQKENQPCTISSKRSKDSMFKGQTTKVPIKKLPMENKPLKQSWNLPKKQHPLRVSSANDILASTSVPPLKALKSENCIEGTKFWDPYGILEFGKRDIGS